jgi:transcriptional regulator with XRE-family HTH domain
MEVFEKVKLYRESRRLSQEFVGAQLNIEQSQYSRRESGQIAFTVDELQNLSQLFEVEISDLMKDKMVVFNNHNQTGGTFGQYINLPEKLIEQFEARLKEKDEFIKLLKQRITDLE